MNSFEHLVGVSTGAIFANARSINPDIKNGSVENLPYRVYPFLCGYNIGIWTATKFVQKRNDHCYSIRISFVENVMQKFDPRGEYATIQNSLVDNMNKPTGYIKTKSSFKPRGAMTKHVWAPGSLNSRTIVCFSVAADG